MEQTYEGHEESHGQFQQRFAQKEVLLIQPLHQCCGMLIRPVQVLETMLHEVF